MSRAIERVNSVVTISCHSLVSCDVTSLWRGAAIAEKVKRYGYEQTTITLEGLFASHVGSLSVASSLPHG